MTENLVAREDDRAEGKRISLPSHPPSKWTPLSLPPFLLSPIPPMVERSGSPSSRKQVPFVRRRHRRMFQ